jgi:hypothetical protein
MHWRGDFVSSFINYIPLIATIVTTVVTVILARATLRYAEASDKGLALAREEFEREWSPELHIKLQKQSANDAQIIVTNLAKISVLLQMVQLRKLTQAVPSLRYFLNEPLVGGMTWTDGMHNRLMAATGAEFQGSIAVSVTFFASGRLFRTDWFRFYVEVKNGDILRLDPINMAARRVRVLEPKNGEARREMVRDATGAVTEDNGISK